MRPIYTLFVAATTILFCSCSSSHKIQNSEDPGYSSGSSRSSSSSGQGDYYSTAPSDNYVRMRSTGDPRWSEFDDNNSYDNYYAYTPAAVSPYYGYGYGMGYSPFGFGYGMYGGFSAMSIGLGCWDPYFGWNSYFMWNMGYNPYFYNPYYGGGVLIVQQPGNYAGGAPGSTGVSHVYSRLPAFNASTYRGGSFASNVRNRRSFGSGRSAFFSRPNYNSGTGRSFSNSAGNSSRTYNTHSPSFTPRSTGGNNGGGGVFGGGSSGRSFGGSSGSSRGFGGGGGGGSFGGHSGFRH